MMTNDASRGTARHEAVPCRIGVHLRASAVPSSFLAPWRGDAVAIGEIEPIRRVVGVRFAVD
jgi:hypothetical protein